MGLSTWMGSECIFFVFDQFAEQEEQFLRASHGKGGNHHRPAMAGGVLDNRGQARANVFLRVQPVAVGGFQQHVIEPVFGHRRVQE